MVDSVNGTSFEDTAVPLATESIGGTEYAVVKLHTGADGVDDGPVEPSNPLPTNDAAAQSALASLLAMFNTSTSTVAANAAGLAVRPIGQETWTCSFTDVGAALMTADMTQLRLGTGVTVSQSGGNLVVVAGTTANAEFLARSNVAWKPPLNMRHSAVLSARVVNNNFMYVLADLIGEGLAYTINSAVSVSVTKPAHGFTANNIGQFMFLGGISGAAGVPGRYAIASIPDANTINFTVAGWPTNGNGNLTLFGWNHVKTLYNGTTVTAALADAQRKGWASGDTTLTTLTSASPGHILQTHFAGREVYWADTLRASIGTTAMLSRGSRLENLPNEDTDLYLFLWSYNGTVAPAGSTSWTVGFVSVEKFAATPVYLQGAELAGTASPAPVQVTGGSIALSSGAVSLVAGNARVGQISTSGLWYDDSSTPLAGAATFTGTSRDISAAATGTVWAVAGAYPQEAVVSAESDVTGTLWIEVSRDNTNWRRVKAVATTAVTGGGFYAEIVHRPSWRYLRVGFTNGAGAQSRFTIGSFFKAN